MEDSKRCGKCQTSGFGADVGWAVRMVQKTRMMKPEHRWLCLLCRVDGGFLPCTFQDVKAPPVKVLLDFILLPKAFKAILKPFKLWELHCFQDHLDTLTEVTQGSSRPSTASVLNHEQAERKHYEQAAKLQDR
jgi:hypothetical protein